MTRVRSFLVFRLEFGQPKHCKRSIEANKRAAIPVVFASWDDKDGSAHFTCMRNCRCPQKMITTRRSGKMIRAGVEPATLACPILAPRSNQLS
jgi:hypothetical protein